MSKNAKAQRVIIVGLDGFDPQLTNRYMAHGRLSNFNKLSREGSYKPLATTCPPVSPVAWSTFQTGVNPGRHAIFDFLTRDKRTYLPKLSSTLIDPARKGLRLWKFSIPLKKIEIKLLRKSKSFWKVLGENGIFSTILRIPITFPPERFYGNILAAMCTPDLRGSQGTFSFYCSNDGEKGQKTGGSVITVSVSGGKVNSYLEGPDDPVLKKRKALKAPFSILLNQGRGEGLLEVEGQKIILKTNQISDWVRVSFRNGLGLKIKGLCRFCLKQIEPSFELYVSPINIDPEHPALPVSSPSYYSRYLAKLYGPFGTLGFMEDTWALKERALCEETFLEQAYLTHDEREKMFFDAIEKTSQGVCACVFDASDRIQHTFWRYLDDHHPARKDNAERFKNTIPDMYEKMDELVGKVMGKLKPDDVLFVLSDHGFKSFRRCVNVNSWLFKNGYLALKNNRMTGSDYFGDVDWSKTTAFSVGMGGVYLNLRGREFHGIIDPGHADDLKREISGKLLDLRDPMDGKKPIRNVYDSQEIYGGPFKHEAPDLIIGWEDGFRASWECVTGKLKWEVFENNMKAWSGDHCVDPEIVPGVLFSNRTIVDEAPRMIDLAPTLLALFDVEIPKYMEGKPLTFAP